MSFKGVTKVPDSPGSEKIGYPEIMELSSKFFRFAFSNFLLVAQTKPDLISKGAEHFGIDFAMLFCYQYRILIRQLENLGIIPLLAWIFNKDEFQNDCDSDSLRKFFNLFRS